MNAGYYVYITANPTKTVLYTGLTNDLNTRLQQHFENRGTKSSFAGWYYCFEPMKLFRKSKERHAERSRSISTASLTTTTKR
ncbi:GIY-YIG nuclease family protein [Hymenobacter lapidiphilus]|uniref:GIY-YIG nuclease family protein n=1 Tax=Hymenobacter lapidiphilus TaxID=2608003 RepID=A0A7Y7PR36_9BACT|nr:GIY-YIG nuclease family protein [Hymenobacter lapidiphilus]NVO32448.1 GIY-YIG nuclease family protein [Hymenobacter lapidiphilus]